MIKHIVMWRLKDFAEGKDKRENAIIIKAGLEDLKNKINQIRHIEVGININESEQAYDIVLYSEFDNIEDLNLYQNHPDHIRISEFVRKVRAIRIVEDYVI
ncbi:MAG: Dabb family protein [Solirubrobacterales bacterium]